MGPYEGLSEPSDGWSEGESGGAGRAGGEEVSSEVRWVEGAGEHNGEEGRDDKASPKTCWAVERASP